MTNKIRNLIIGGVVAVVIITGGLVYYFFGTDSAPEMFYATAQTGNITEEINLTGNVKASQGVDLAFESQGKVVANYVKTGDKIYAGEPLMAIDSSVLQSQLQQAQAQLDELDINTVQSKNDAAMQALYATSLSDAQKSVSTAKGILLTISDIQFNHFIAQTQENTALQNAMAKSVYSLLGQQNAGLWTSQNIALLNGGAFGLVQDAVANPTDSNIDSSLSATQTALQDVSNLVNAVPIDPALTATEREAIGAAQASINMEIITTSGNISSIATAKVDNSASIATTNSQIQAAQANIDAIKTQISKTVLTALFNGQVDKDDTVVGQIVSPNEPVMTISNSNLEIDTNIPEIDMADSSVGENANINLDAFGNNTIFPATIISIDTAPTVVDGISVYAAKLKFTNYDSRIKDGMTANINLISGTHSNVVTVPISAVIQQNGKYFVIVESTNSQRESREVTVGFRDDKNIEITSGLKAGEKVLAY